MSKSADDINKRDLKLSRRVQWAGHFCFLFISCAFLFVTAFESRVSNQFDSARSVLKTSAELQINEGEAADQPVNPKMNSQHFEKFVNWRSSIVLLIGALLSALALSARSIFEAIRTDKKRALTLEALLVPLAFVFLATANHGDQSTSVLSQVATAAEAFNGSAANAELHNMLLFPKRIGEMLSVILGLAMVSTLIMPQQVTREMLITRIKRLRVLLLTSAALLAIGVFVNSAAYQFAFSYIVPAPDNLKALVEATTSLTAATYTLFLVLGYFPCNALFMGMCDQLMREDGQSPSKEERHAWFQDNGIELDWKPKLVRGAAIASPALSAILASLGLG